MLDDSPSLRAFVERMTRINKGRALYTRPDRLGEYLLVDYMAKKRKRGVTRTSLEEESLMTKVIVHAKRIGARRDLFAAGFLCGT